MKPHIDDDRDVREGRAWMSDADAERIWNDDVRRIRSGVTNLDDLDRHSEADARLVKRFGIAVIALVIAALSMLIVTEPHDAAAPATISRGAAP